MQRAPAHFPVLEIRPRRGRVFSKSDGVAGVPVVIINESFASISWPSEDPLGKRLRLVMRTLGALAGTGSGAQPWLTVVGVVPDIVQSDTSQGSHDPLIYLPYRQLPQREMVVAARTLVPPDTLSNAFRREVQALDGDLPVTDLRTLDAMLWERTRSWRVYGSMLSIFAAMALLLASVGEQGNAMAQFAVGFMFEKGSGVPKDDGEAANWYRKAAEQGYAMAQFNLGVKYANGDGVVQNYEEAIKWFRRSAEQVKPDPNATNTLGLVYEQGTGVARDYIQAYLWYSVAVEQGSEFSRANLTSLQGRMTPQQVAEAQRQVELWKAQHPRP